MYVSVDLDNLVFRHKHAEHGIVSCLAFIELSGVAVSSLPVAPNMGINLRYRLTENELRQLYRNTTGHMPAAFDVQKLYKLLYEAADALPVTDCVALEVRKQANAINSDDQGFFKYVKGSNRAAIAADLYLPPALQVRGAAAPPQAVAAGPTAAPRAAAGSSTAASAAPACSAPVTSPALGTVKAVVWLVADRVWDEAGKPTALPRVLELRKQMMDVLEREHNIKRTSSSTALGEWQKARLK